MKKYTRWTEERKSFLIENYPFETQNFLMENLGISWDSILHKASELKVIRRNIFTQDEIDFIVDNYKTMRYRDIAKILKRDESTVACKINNIGLVKTSKWTNKEIELLKESYPNYTNKYLSEKIFPDRAIYSIRTKANKMGIHKSILTGRKRYDQETLIEDLIALSEKLNRTPMLEDLVKNGLASGKTYERYFDGYRNACRIAGLKINSNLWGRSIICESISGDICFSKSEKIITDFFIENNIRYEKEVRYDDILEDNRCGERIVDWILPNNIFVEYFGMPEKPLYKEKMNEKIKLCKENNIILIEVYRKDLKKLHKVFVQFL